MRDPDSPRPDPPRPDPPRDDSDRGCLGDLYRYMKGRWSLLRHIEDRRGGLDGTLVGEAVFESQAGGLFYRETGWLRFGTYYGRSYQTYLYRFPGAGRVEVRFADGRFFHGLDLTSGNGEAEHLCAQDHYRTRVELTTDHRWTARWRVLGPAKDLLLNTWYLRCADLPACRHAGGAADCLPGSC